MPSKARKNEMTREMIRRTVRQVEVLDNTIILVQSGSPLATKGSINLFVESLYKSGRRGGLVVVVDDFTDLSVLDEKAMNYHGWYKIDDKKIENPVASLA